MSLTQPTRAFIFLFLALMSSYSIWGQDYVAVFEEAHHIPVFENSRQRILHVKALPADTTELHRHCHPILYLTLQGTTVNLREPQTKWREVKLPKGWVGHDTYHQDSCFVHQFTVVDEGPLEIIAFEAIEKTGEVNANIQPIYDAGGFKLYRLSSKNDQIWCSHECATVAVPQRPETNQNAFSQIRVKGIKGKVRGAEGFSTYVVSYDGYTQNEVEK
jgi:hypothetical protein